jgi:hypothetical protein
MSKRNVNTDPELLTGQLVGVRFSPEEHQSLLQLHSVYNFTRKGWTLPRIVREACRLGAMRLSLPIPGAPYWPVRKLKRDAKYRWSDLEFKELSDRFEAVREELTGEYMETLQQRLVAIREEILSRR